MSKLEQKKKQKREALLLAAFSLFTSKGINETSIADIVSEANMAKGTFYLYFKDKYDIRDKLIVENARKLFDKALVDMLETECATLEEKVISIADHVINELNENKILLRFISKNLSWGVFHDMLVTGGDDASGITFYEGYCQLLEQSGRKFRNPDLMLYMIVELINSTCHNVILMQEPVELEELKPELYGVICDIIHRQEIETEWETS
ncbi:MAG: TetR/AcrR family transcriptional regulator [Eubacterium sp.]|nr:TetR/AcrR family transcriptional regulator [Eubacterium sp.]